MRTLVFAAALALVLAVPASWAANTVTPTTTLTAETANNTSASSSWTNASTGDAIPGNVSKLPLRSLLYAGATTRLWAHYMPWFGESWHIDVGYNSSDPAQAAATADDMASRGFNGLIVDWYGPNAAENNATLVMLNAINARSDGFQFMIMEDAGALKKCSQTSGCDVQQQLIDDITYIYNTFASSPHYYKENGRFVVPNFDVDSRYPSIDWSVVRASVPGNPLFVFRNAGGFTKSYSDGGYSWVDPLGDTTSDPADLKYFTYFYPVALQTPSKMDFGSAYPGFNDNLASWGQNRIIVQQCGQTWLSTFAQAGKYFSSATQLPHLQVPTWNDYEEGTEIETGVDNCVQVSASLSGTVLNWSISGGQENTIHHYTVFISSDGENLMAVQDVSAGTHSLDLSSFNFAAGDYSLYVKAVGQPSIQNKMSSRVTWSVAAPDPAPSPTKSFTLSSSNSSQTINAGQAASYSLSLTPVNGFTGSVDMNCAGAPSGATCTATPDPAAVASGAVAVTVTLSTSAGKSAALHTRPSTYLAFLLWMPVGLVAVGHRRSRKLLVGLTLALVCGAMLLLQACGGAAAVTTTTAQSSKSGGTPAGTYKITVQGASGTLSASSTLTLIVK